MHTGPLSHLVEQFLAASVTSAATQPRLLKVALVTEATKQSTKRAVGFRMGLFAQVKAEYGLLWKCVVTLGQALKGHGGGHGKGKI